jgi:hypothetical protein
MKGATLKINLYPQVIKKVLDNAVYALEHTGQDILDITIKEGKIPYETGELQNSAKVVIDKVKGSVSIIHSAPYAQRLYFNPAFNFRKDKNPKAQALWYDNWFGSDRDKVKRLYTLNFRKENTRYLK